MAADMEQPMVQTEHQPTSSEPAGSGPLQQVGLPNSGGNGRRLGIVVGEVEFAICEAHFRVDHPAARCPRSAHPEVPVSRDGTEAPRASVRSALRRIRRHRSAGSSGL